MKKIEQAREIRLWLQNIIIPLIGFAVYSSNKEAINKKLWKFKMGLKNAIDKW